jgi:type II secretory pathway pseudopilin PulG
MFCKKNKIKNSDKTITKKGVTLLEVIVIVGIFGMLMAVVMFKYSSFNNNILLTNMAYEVALSVREAQFFGTAVKGYGGKNDDFEKNIGIHFSQGLDSYMLFIDEDNDGYNTTDGIDPITMQRGIYISELKNCTSGASPGVLDIIFDRPNPEPILLGNPAEVQIQISTPDRNNHRYVRINSVGAIDVLAESC